MNKKDVLTAPSVAYISALGGVEIKDIEYNINDYVLCVSGAWCSKKTAHRVKIRYTSNGAPYIIISGYRLRLDDAIRM